MQVRTCNICPQHVSLIPHICETQKFSYALSKCNIFAAVRTNKIKKSLNKHLFDAYRGMLFAKVDHHRAENLKERHIDHHIIFDILKIYLKFAITTLVLYFLAEWYLMNYDTENIDNVPTSLTIKSSTNSTVDKLFRFVLDFLIH
uniref:Uncharacterized protein n=1 Tax=Glossina austeni TaxID=7395 RepID=A0A1A9VN24_GLOAU